MPKKSGVCLPAVRVFAQGTIAQDAIKMMSRRLRQGAVMRAGQGCNDGVEGVTAQLRLHRYSGMKAHQSLPASKREEDSSLRRHMLAGEEQRCSLLHHILIFSE